MEIALHLDILLLFVLGVGLVVLLLVFVALDLLLVLDLVTDVLGCFVGLALADAYSVTYFLGATLLAVFGGLLGA